MKTCIKTILAAGLFIFAIASPVMAVASPQPVSAASECEGRVLGIPPWYRGLTGSAPDCAIQGPDQLFSGEEDALSKFIWRIVLNVVEMAIVIVAYVAIFFILYGGFLFLTGGAIPAQTEKARKTIIQAVVGLVIAMAAIALTNLTFSIIT